MSKMFFDTDLFFLKNIPHRMLVELILITEGATLYAVVCTEGDAIAVGHGAYAFNSRSKR
jgi:hypothetical protein